MGFLSFLPSSMLKDLDKARFYLNDHGTCNNCNRIGSICFEHELYADFDLRVIDKFEWNNKFRVAEDGICLFCGHFQRYSRISNENLKEYLEILMDKSKTCEGIISKANRLDELKVLSQCNIIRELRQRYDKSYKTIFVARPSSWELIVTLEESYPSAKICYYENNSMVQSDISSHMQSSKDISSTKDCNVHGELDIPMDAELIIINHCLQHSIDLNSDMVKLYKYIKAGGEVLLLDEVQRKLHNPFHINHLAESFLINLFKIAGIKSKIIEDLTTPADKTINGLQSSNCYSGLFFYD